MASASAVPSDLQTSSSSTTPMPTASTSSNQNGSVVLVSTSVESNQAHTMPESSSGELSQITEESVILSPDVLALWKDICPELSEQQRKDFSRLVCNGFEEYLAAFVTDCEALHDKSLSTKITHFLQPLYFILSNVATPILKTASTASGVPLPADLALGGVRGVLNITKAVPDLQKRALALLLRIGTKARTLQSYNWTLSRKQPLIQKALLMVYGDIVVFCQMANDLFSIKEQSRLRRWKNKIEMIFLDRFTEKLGDQVTKFENDFESLKDEAQSLQTSNTQIIMDTQGQYVQQQSDFQETSRRFMQFSAEILAHSQGIAEETRMRKTKKRSHKEEKELRQLFNKCTSWISSLGSRSFDFRQRYRDRCNSHLQGTGEWFLNSKQYLDWKTSEQSDILWVQGNPGSGKSILSAIAITDISNDGMYPDIGVAYAFCVRAERRDQSVVTLVGNMIGQLLRQCNELNTDVRNAHQKSEAGRAVESDEVFELLNSTAEAFDTVYLIVDAVDEFENPKSLLRGLLNALDDSRFQRRLKILVLSRQVSEVVELLKRRSCKPIQPEKENHEDIKSYIETFLPDEEVAQARELCLKKARGMFMWVRLVFEDPNIRHATNNDLIKILDKLPEELNGLYNTIFKDLSSQLLRDKAWLVLHWMLASYRPLSLEEMLEAVGDYTNVTSIKKIQKYKTGEALVQLCRNLIHIDHEGDVLFIHDSVTQYLMHEETNDKMLEEFRKEHKNAHNILGAICLNYLQLEEFDEALPSSKDEFRELFRKYPFAEYACFNWGDHAADGDPDLHGPAILEVVESCTRRELTIQLTLDKYFTEKPLWYFPESTSVLHGLAFFKLPSIAEGLLNSTGAEIEYMADGAKATPLSYAMKHGREEMALWLIGYAQSNESTRLDTHDLRLAAEYASSRGWISILHKLKAINSSSIDMTLDDGWTALTLACTEEEELTATELITKLGANPSLPGHAGITPLIAAASRQLRPIIFLLLERGVDVNAADDEGRTALHWAAANKDEKTAIALLKKHADPMFPTKHIGRTPIHEAAENNAVSVLRKMHFYDHELDFSVMDSFGNTPLHFAALANATRSAKVLLEFKCSKDAVDQNGQTALHKAAGAGALETVIELISVGCDMKISDEDGDTALHLAALTSNYEVVNFVIGVVSLEIKEFLLSARNKRNESIFHLACQAGCQLTVRKLIEERADVNAPGFLNYSPLHYAAYFDHGHLVELLLSHSRTANAKASEGLQPLHVAAKAKNVDFIKQMIRICTGLGVEIDCSSFSDYKRTPLFYAVAEGDHVSTQILYPLTHSSTLAVADVDGNHLIHLAACSGDQQLIKSLLEQNHDVPNIAGFNGRTPLACAVLNGMIGVVKYLAPLSLECLETTDSFGRTPLLIALANKQILIADYLLDLQASLHQVDCEGFGPLHLAAITGNINIFKRLLKLGCRCFSADDQGTNPFHLAAACGPVAMIDALLENGYSEFQAVDLRGWHAGMYAALSGRLDILNKLKHLKVPLGWASLEGSTIAHITAEFGHLSALKWLRVEGFDLFERDRDGVTPFLIAAACGYPQVVEYLLYCRPESLFDQRTWDGETAIISTTSLLKEETKNQLIIASFNLLPSIDGSVPLELSCIGPFLHRDTLGFTFSDLERSGNKAFPNTQSVTHEKRREMQAGVVRYWLNRLTGSEIVSTRFEGEMLMRSFTRLARALRLSGEFELSNLCILPMLYEPWPSYLSCSIQCGGCSVELRQKKIFACQSCHIDCDLCEECHESYIAAGRDVPDALVNLLSLEERVRTARLVCQTFPNFLVVILAFHRLVICSDFLETTLASYKIWEQDYMAYKKYPMLDRPGQRWLELVNEFLNYIKQVGMATEPVENMSNKIDDFNWRYDVFERQWRPDKECTKFRCKGHQYTKISPEDYQTHKSAAILYNSQTGQPTPELLRRIAEKIGIKEDEGNSCATESNINTNSADNENIREDHQIQPSDNITEPSTAAKAHNLAITISENEDLSSRLHELALELSRQCTQVSMADDDELEARVTQPTQNEILDVVDQMTSEQKLSTQIKKLSMKDSTNIAKLFGETKMEDHSANAAEGFGFGLTTGLTEDTKDVIATEERTQTVDQLTLTPGAEVTSSSKMVAEQAQTLEDQDQSESDESSSNEVDRTEVLLNWKLSQLLNRKDDDWDRLGLKFGLKLADAIRPGSRSVIINGLYDRLQRNDTSGQKA